MNDAVINETEEAEIKLGDCLSTTSAVDSSPSTALPH
jgi:hypothetical protein